LVKENLNSSFWEIGKKERKIELQEEKRLCRRQEKILVSLDLFEFFWGRFGFV
jgi:hypothetical protein